MSWYNLAIVVRFVLGSLTTLSDRQPDSTLGGTRHAASSHNMHVSRGKSINLAGTSNILVHKILLSSINSFPSCLGWSTCSSRRAEAVSLPMSCRIGGLGFQGNDSGVYGTCRGGAGIS